MDSLLGSYMSQLLLFIDKFKSYIVILWSLDTSYLHAANEHLMKIKP